MNVAKHRALNVVGGLVAFLVGAGFFLASLYVVRLPLDPLGARPEPTVNIEACQGTLRSLGFEVKRSRSELVAERPTLQNPQLLLANASTAISLCHLPLTRFCMGKACQRPDLPGGLSFALATHPKISR